MSWKSSKQAITADSTTKALYVVTHDTTKEAIGIQKFLSEVDVVPTILSPIPLYCDNNGAIA